MSSNNYMLLTAARNEEDYIENTIQSVVAQTTLPFRWVIISDGSTDKTDEIVTKYAKQYSFIKLLRIEENKKRNFASKVQALQRGEKLVKDMEYNFIGNVDADISFDSCYFENILKKFRQNEKLGVAGGAISEKQNGKFKPRRGNSVKSVAGAVQFFRRQCYDSIGGYYKLNYGIDWYANVMARKHGWQVETFPELEVHHHRTTAKFDGNVLGSRFRMGIRDYTFGSHPLFEIFKCFRRLKEKPYFLVSIFRLSGFIWASLKKTNRVVPDEFVQYLRKEQKERLKIL